MAPDSLRFRLDRLHEESFARGAAKPCGEWGGDALKSPSRFGARFSRQSHENGSFAAKTRSSLKIIFAIT